MKRRTVLQIGAAAPFLSLPGAAAAGGNLATWPRVVVAPTPDGQCPGGPATVLGAPDPYYPHTIYEVQWSDGARGTVYRDRLGLPPLRAPAAWRRYVPVEFATDTPGQVVRLTLEVERVRPAVDRNEGRIIYFHPFEWKGRMHRRSATDALLALCYAEGRPPRLFGLYNHLFGLYNR